MLGETISLMLLNDHTTSTRTNKQTCIASWFFIVLAHCLGVSFRAATINETYKQYNSTYAFLLFEDFG